MKNLLKQWTFLIVAIGIWTIVASQRCLAGPTVTVGKNVPQADWVPVDQIDHSAWTNLLQKYVDDRGLVDYAAWKATPSDMAALDQYLEHLSTAAFTPQTSRNQKLAFWINAYNAVTIKGILREYPTTSIRNHTATLFGYNIWKDLKLIVEGKPYSLDDMEHEILRKLGEPRIHFAIVCASLGCPRLLNEAYEPEQLEEQLADNARDFFADPKRFTFNPHTNEVGLSPILDWFAEDIGSTMAQRLMFITPYLPKEVREQLLPEEVEVSFLDYDWNLNDRSKEKAPASP